MSTRRFAAAGEAITPVPTAFLADELPDAPSDYVKVYLYGLYLAGQATEAQETEMETSLHMKSSEIDEAFRYWQARGLVQIMADGTVRFGSGAEVHAEEPYPYVAFNLRIADILGHAPSAQNLTRMYAWMEEYGFPQEVVLLLVEHCALTKGTRVSINYMEKLAQAWADAGVNSIATAQAEIDEYKRKNGGARQVMRQMGIFDRGPGKTEFDLYEKWTTQWGFTHDSIVQAMNGREFNMSSPFKYLDAILSDHHEKGHTTAQEIAAENSERSSERDRIRELVHTLGFRGTGQRREYDDAYHQWQEWGFTFPVMKLACAEASQVSKGRLERASELLSRWKAHGAVSEPDVRAELQAEKEMDELISEMFDLAGIRRAATDRDRRLYREYTESCSMEHDVLLYAAELSSIAEEPDHYIRGVLRRWAERNVHTLTEAREAAAEFAQSFGSPGTSATAVYAQRLPSADADKRALDAMFALESEYGS